MLTVVMGSFYTFLENFMVENWFSFFMFIVPFLFVIYKYVLQDSLGLTVGNRPNHVTRSNINTKCSKPDCVRCRARAKEKMYMEIHRRMANILSDVGESQWSQDGIGLSGRLRNSFEQQLTTGIKPTVDDEDGNQNPSMFYLQELSRKHSYEHLNDFPNYVQLVSEIKSHFIDIREEFDIVWNDFFEGSNIEGWQENTLSEGKWYTFHLMNQGQKQSYSMQRCPKTSKMLETLELLMSDCIFGFATFSVVMPGTHIESHCGATNVRLRCHLGLHIPEGCCRLTVNGETLHWKEKECLVFDDSFVHEAEHYGTDISSPRSVFMLDIWHPCLSSEEKKMLKFVFHSDLLQS